MKKKRRNIKKEKQILKEYQENNCSVKELLERYKLNSGSFVRMRNRHGVPKRSRPISKNPEYINKAVELHDEGLKGYEIACRLNTSSSSVSSIFKEVGVKSNASQLARKTSLDETVFENIETIPTAYWLGFLLSRGSISYNEKRNTYRIVSLFKEEYYESIYKLREFFKTDRKIEFIPPKGNTKCNTYRLTINSKKLCLEIMNLGVLPRKSISRNFKFHEFEDKDLNKAFARGYIDSRLTFVKSNKKYFYYKVSGNKQVLKKIKSILKENGVEVGEINSNASKTYYLNIHGIENQIHFLNEMHDNNPAFTTDRIRMVLKSSIELLEKQEENKVYIPKLEKILSTLNEPVKPNEKDIQVFGRGKKDTRTHYDEIMENEAIRMYIEGSPISSIICSTGLGSSRLYKLIESRGIKHRLR